jgi:hypothetical protein
MYYTVYQIINKVNGKVYIGKHITNNLDDGYMGSGKLIRFAIKKYGIENFDKVIIAIYNNENMMNVVEKFLAAYDPETTYNLCEGGKGGWGYVNKTRNHKENSRRAAESRDYSKMNKSYSKNNQWSKTCSAKRKLDWELGKYTFVPSTKGISFKKKKDSSSGTKNSQYGTIWITNGSKNQKIKITDDIPKGWHRGRF